MTPRQPNLLLLITDQQRAPQHWPDDPAWRRALTPAEHELERTGVSFRRAFCASCMCSPSRASLLTGLYPARHGVPLTLTSADLRPDVRNLPAVTAKVGRMLWAGSPPRRRVLRQYLRGLLPDPDAGDEPELPAAIPTLASRLRAVGYHVAYKGKWHLSQPAGAGGWSDADAEAIERDYGFSDWEPPDAGENAKAESFGGGYAGLSGAGWDEDFIRQAERWLGAERLPEPFCLVLSLVNPHDVLGYPASYETGGYRVEDFRELGVGLPSTIDEDLREKPTAHAMMQLGMTAYLGPLRSRREQLDYVNFYAYLHRLVDEKIGRLLAALGDPDRPDSLRARTVIVRTADHGEMGLSHGGLRQKAFNAYEETIRVPLVISNPLLFDRPAETDALTSLVDVLPTLLGLAGAPTDGELQGHDLAPILAASARAGDESLERAGIDLAAVNAAEAQASVRSAVHFSYDDHQAATAMTEAPGKPNRVRAVREANAKYAAYVDPDRRVASEYELYDLERDPDERHNLVDPRTGAARDAAAERLRSGLAEHLAAMTDELGTAI